MIVNVVDPVFYKVNNIIIGPLVVLTFFSLFIDTATYSGFLSKIIGISSDQLFILTTISLIIYFFSTIGQKVQVVNEDLDLLLRLNYLGFPIFLLLVFSLSQIEQDNFPNYVFATYHVHLVTAQKILLISFLLLLFSVSKKKLYSKVTKYLQFIPTKKPFFMTQWSINEKIFFIVCVVFVIAQTGMIYQKFSEHMIQTIKFAKFSYQEKYPVLFGPVYYQFKQIKTFVPESSIVAVAPQSFDGIIGNIGFSRYFLYPIYLIHPIEHNYKLSEVDYVIISSNLTSIEEQTYEVWPSEGFKTSGGILIDKESNTFERIVISEYKPNDPQFYNKVGVLKVQK